MTSRRGGWVCLTLLIVCAHEHLLERKHVELGERGGNVYVCTDDAVQHLGHTSPILLFAIVNTHIHTHSPIPTHPHTRERAAHIHTHTRTHTPELRLARAPGAAAAAAARVFACSRGGSCSCRQGICINQRAWTLRATWTSIYGCGGQ